MASTWTAVLIFEYRVLHISALMYPLIWHIYFLLDLWLDDCIKNRVSLPDVLTQSLHSDRNKIPLYDRAFLYRKKVIT